MRAIRVSEATTAALLVAAHPWPADWPAFADHLGDERSDVADWARRAAEALAEAVHDQHSDWDDEWAEIRLTPAVEARDGRPDPCFGDDEAYATPLEWATGRVVRELATVVTVELAWPAPPSESL